MSTPNISTKSSLAEALATALGKSVAELDAMGGPTDGQIEFYSIARGEGRLSLKSRIVPEEGIGYCTCENAFIVDNGDGKISAGDLFLHADGYYMEDGEYAFRFAKLFEPRTVQKKLGLNAERESANLPVDAALVLGAIEMMRGESVRTISDAMKKVCQ